MPQPPPADAAASPPSPAQEPAHPGRLFGGVYGTVLASALLAALHSAGEDYMPLYDALWVLVTAVTTALAHGYAHHMTTGRPAPARTHWRTLGPTFAGEWPLVAACMPSVVILLLAAAAGWPERPCTEAGLALNTVLLFLWGAVASRRIGSGRRDAVLTGVSYALLGLLVAVANSIIK